MNLKKINRFEKNFSDKKAEKEFLKLLSQRKEIVIELWKNNSKLFRLNIAKDMIILVLVGAVIFLGLRKEIAFIYTQLDSTTGAPLNVEVVRKSNTKIGEKEIKYFIARFVLDIRTVPIDKDYYNNMLKEKNLFLTNNSQGKLNDMIRTDGILLLLQEEKTSVAKITSINMLTNSKNTYQIRWSEDVFAKSGEKIETRKYIGIFSVDFKKIESESEALKNPLGLIIKDFSVSKENN